MKPNLFKTAPLWAGPGASAGGVLIEDGGLTVASEEAGGGDGGEFTIVEDRAGTRVFLTIGDGAEALGAGACVGDFDGECEGDWAQVDIEEMGLGF